MSNAELIEAKNVSLNFRVRDPLVAVKSDETGLIPSVGAIMKKHRGYTEVDALCDISFSVMPGDRLALLGHNGSGKSTLLRLLAGVYPPTTGTLAVRGTIQSMIDLSLGLESDYSARENFSLRRALLGIDVRNIDAYRDEVFSIAGLGSYIDLPIRTYSTGMMLRLAFAMAYVSSAEILLMDEWLAVGDQEFRDIASNLLRDKVSGARAVVMATHDIGLAKSVCSTFIKLEHGRIVDAGKW